MSAVLTQNLPASNMEKNTTGALLAQQLTAMLTRVCDGKLDSGLIETTLKLVLDNLEMGKVSLNMQQAVTSTTEGSVENWQQKLLESGVAVNADDEGGFAPLIIDEDQLYLARYHLYHTQLNKRLIHLAQQSSEKLDEKVSIELLNRLFHETNVTPNMQKVAAALALKKRLCIISGGPGTGKTTTVLRLLAALCSSNDKLRIALAAPTGKAAARMQDSIRNNIKKIDCNEEVRKQLSLPATTLHRLLGYKPNSVTFRHNANNPLAVDVLVIDESSMIDTAMMAKCLDALPETAQIILLGDKDQLAAVEPGSPFASICSQFGFSEAFVNELEILSGQSLKGSAVVNPQPLADNLIFLHHSYRFGEDSGIRKLSQAVNNGQFAEAVELMRSPDKSDISWQDYKALDFRHYGSKLEDPLIQKVQLGFSAYCQALKSQPVDVNQIFESFDQFCILTAIHQGSCGRIKTNDLCQRALGFTDDKIWYHGRPVMVSKNDYQTGLYNGDVGICLDVESNGQLRVYFPINDGYKDFTPSRIPAHETAFAMTVHKSQGSEFNEVLFLLPDSANAVFNKSLVYTAITRAKDKVGLWGQVDVLLACES